MKYKTYLKLKESGFSNDDIQRYSGQSIPSPFSNQETLNKSAETASESIPDSFTTLIKKRLSETEGNISKRQSLMGSLMKEPATFSSFGRNPFKKSLETLGAGGELTEGVASDVGLALQRGDLRGLGGEIKQTLLGKRPAQFGDIFKAAGASPLASSVGGLLASSYSGKGLTSGINKATNVSRVVEKVGKPIAVKTMSILSAVPEESISKAISNPNFLSRGWISETGKKVQDAYRRVIQPLIDDSTKKIDVTSMSDVAGDTGVITRSGEWGKTFASMKPGEQRKFLKWERELQKGDLSFNEVDSLIGDIDSTLKSVYRQKDLGKAVDYSDDAVRVATEIRAKLNKLRKTQYPEAGKVLSAYEDWSGAKNVYHNFDKWRPQLMPVAVGQAGLGVIGGLTGAWNPAVAGGLILAGVPKIQSAGIRAGREVSKLASYFSPQIISEQQRKLQGEKVF